MAKAADGFEEVRTKAAAEKAIKAGKPTRIVAGKFALAIAGLTGVNIQIEAAAGIELSLTDVVGIVSQKDMWTSRVVAWGSSRVVARESSSVEAWESSSVVARGSSRVVARGSSRVVARGSSRVEAWGSSSVEAWESSRVEARGYSMLQAHGDRCKISASAGVAVNLWDGAAADGGRQLAVKQETAQDWCDYYGARVDGDAVVLYKAVGEDYVSNWGVKYAPGSMPRDEKWDGRKRECAAGGGLNFSPTPRHTQKFVNSPKHYLECRVLLNDLVVHFGGQYPEKVCAREVCSPLIEVDVDGSPIESAA